MFTATANGTRVRFDRLTPAPFSLDIGTAEKLVLNMNGGDDSFTATGNLAALIQITVDGGAGSDTIDGQQGNDVVFMAAGDDVFIWDPGDGSNTVEGQEGLDTMRFNGTNIAEIFDISANGSRVRFSRNVASIVMDLDDVERIELNGSSSDNVVIVAGGPAGTTVVSDAGAVLEVTGAEMQDVLSLQLFAGDDVLEASGVPRVRSAFGRRRRRERRDHRRRGQQHAARRSRR
jgi:Ca2+-binding RTX toxin-like protein